MASSSFPSLKGLVVFRNDIHQALFRSVHVYEFEGGVEEIVEREYAFHLVGAYDERKSPGKVFTLQNFNVSAHHAELPNGVWVCILAFNKDHISQFDLGSIPEILCVVRNPKLASIPTLARDLDVICQLKCRSENRESSENGESSKNQTQETMEGPSERPQSVDFDLNSVPLSDSDDEGNEERAAGLVDKKQKRATTGDISRLTMDDLSKYFDLPIIEASKNLKVGLTVLKRKCREFGISRWPHRKIKSLDGLIHNLQEEVIRQLEEDKAAAMAVAKRQRMIESEKEKIEKKPSLDIQRETKKFRQDIFKRRHRARLLGSQSRNLSLF